MSNVLPVSAAGERATREARPFLFVLLLLFTTAAHAQIDIQPLEVCTPLFTAEFDVRNHRLIELTGRVTLDTIIRGKSRPRNWWADADLASFSLEDHDYDGSGLDRGHVYALLWASGSPDWKVCNCTAFITPQHPATNRGPIKALEQYIVELAETEPVTVRIVLNYPPIAAGEDAPTIPIADSFTYHLQCGDVAEVYTIPNTPTPRDYREYRE